MFIKRGHLDKFCVLLLVKMAPILPPDSGDKPNAPLMWPSEGFTRQDSLDPYQLPVRFSQMNKSKAGPARF